MDISRTLSEGYKVYLALGAVGLAVLWQHIPRRAATLALAVLAVVSTLNYARWGPRLLVDKADSYDLVHYYLNAKYFEELQYFDLYAAAILADHDNGGPRFDEGNRYMAQDEAGHAYKPIGHALERGRQVRSERFSEERWKEFEHDLLYLQRERGEFTDQLWRQMIQDHGYNGTPVWTVIARPIAQLVPVESVKLLCYIDLFLLGGALWFVGRVYGRDPALWCLLFLMLTYSARWPTLSWAFLRYDYVAALLVAMALVRKGRPFWGGVLAGYAATLRLFPAMWLYGPGMKGLAGLTRKVVSRPLLVLALGFVVGAGVLEGASALVLGLDTIKVHIENMEDHNSPEQLSSRRIGLALALPFRGEMLPTNIEPQRKQTIKEQKPLRLALAGGLMLAMGWGLRKSRDDETFAFGFVPFFLLTTASYYYLVTRITLVLAHAAGLKTWRNRVGLGWLLGLEVFSNWSETAHSGHRVFLIGGLAWGITAYIIIMTVWLLWEAGAPEGEGQGEARGADGVSA